MDRNRLLEYFFELPFVGLAAISFEEKRWVCFNDYLCEMLGYSREHLAGLTWTQLIHPEDLAGDMAQLELVAAARCNGYSGDRRFLKGDGSALQVNVSVKAARRPDGSPEALIAMVQDIAERKNVEQELREGEARLRDLLGSLDDVVWSAPLDGARLLYINEAAQRVYGRPVEAFFADPQLRMQAVLPTDAMRVRAEFDRLKETGRSESEYRIVRADGAVRWLYERCRVIGVESGSSARIAGTVTDVTARKHADEALRTSEERFRALTNVAPVGVFRIDESGACVYVNRTWCELAGIEEDRALGQGWEGAFHPDERSAVMANWIEVVSQGRLFLRECRFLRPSGVEMWVIAQATPELNANGRVTGYVGCITDVTELKQIQAALRDSEAKLAHAQAVAQLGNYEIYYSPTDSRLQVSMSAEAARIFGLDPLSPPMPLKEFFAMLHPDDGRRVESAYDIARCGGSGRYELEYRIVRADAVRRVVHDVAEIGHDSDGRPGQVFGVVQDVTARRHAEEAAMAARRFAQEVLDNAEQGFVLYDPDLRVVEWNRFLEILTGVPRRAAVGKSLYELFPSLRGQGAESYFKRAFAGETVVEDRFFPHLRGSTDVLRSEAVAAHRDDPRLVWTLSTYAPHRSHEGGVTGVLVNVADMTALKRSQDSLLESNERLRQLTQYLDRVREEERVRIARELHDELGSTLTGVKWAVSMAIDRAHEAALPADAQLIHASQLLDSAVDTMRRIISDLRPSVLDQLGIWAAIEWYAGQVQEQTHLPCRVSISAEVADTVVDPERATAMFRIVQESLTNIVRHANASSVEIRAHRESGAVKIEIEDDGVGICDEVRINSVSWGLIGMHERAVRFGGKITLSGRPGEGTTVVLCMPV